MIKSNHFRYNNSNCGIIENSNFIITDNDVSNIVRSWDISVLIAMKMIKNSEHDNGDNDAEHNKNRFFYPSLLYNSMVLVIKTIVIREYDSGIRGWQSRRATPPTVMIQITGMTVMQFPPFCQRPLRSKPPSCSPYPPSPPPPPCLTGRAAGERRVQ